MATITLLAGKNRILWIGATTTIDSSSFPWYTVNNVNSINTISPNRLGYISNKPTTQYPAFTQFILAAAGDVPYAYELDLKASIALDSTLIALVSVQLAIPTIISLSPTSGVAGDVITITGTNFYA